MYVKAVGSPSNLTNTNRLNPQFTSINVRGADGDSYYNGVNFFVRGGNLFHQGLTLTTNYTYAHSTDNTSSTFTDGQSNGDVGGVAYFDPYNHALDHGNSDFDVKHRISVGTIWAIPYADHTTGFTRAALGGWEIGAIFAASTGTPFTMTIAACPLSPHALGSGLLNPSPTSEQVTLFRRQRRITSNTSPSRPTPSVEAATPLPTAPMAIPRSVPPIFQRSSTASTPSPVG